MGLIRRYLCNEGSGDVMTDQVGEVRTLEAVSGDNIQWGTGEVFHTFRSFVTLGHTHRPIYDGLITNPVEYTSLELANFTEAFVGRAITGFRDGTVISFFDHEIRTWGYALELYDGTAYTLVQESEMKFAQWAVYVLVGRSGQYVDVYVNDMATPLRTIDVGVGNLLGSGIVATLMHGGSLDPSGMEIADISVYDHSMSQADREAYVAQFAESIPEALAFYKDPPDDFGGLWRWDMEAGAKYSELTIEDAGGEDAIRFEGDLTCPEVAVYLELPRSMTEIWCMGSLYIPVGFTGNTSIGDDFKIMTLYEDGPTAVANERFCLEAHYISGTKEVHLEEVAYTNSVGTTNVPVTTIILDEGVWHHFKMYVNLTTGVFQCWHEGTLIADLSGLTLDLGFDQIYWGLADGVVALGAAGHFHMKGFYVGETDREANAGRKSLFTQRANLMVINKFIKNIFLTTV